MDYNEIVVKVEKIYSSCITIIADRYHVIRQLISAIDRCREDEYLLSIANITPEDMFVYTLWL